MPKLPDRITREWLEHPSEHEPACKDQVELFAAHWPDGVDLTPESLREAARIGLDVIWLTRLLPPHQALRVQSQDKALWASVGAQVKALWASFQIQEAEIMIKALWPDEERHEPTTQMGAGTDTTSLSP